MVLGFLLPPLSLPFAVVCVCEFVTTWFVSNKLLPVAGRHPE